MGPNRFTTQFSRKTKIKGPSPFKIIWHMRNTDEHTRLSRKKQIPSAIFNKDHNSTSDYYAREMTITPILFVLLITYYDEVIRTEIEDDGEALHSNYIILFTLL